MKAVWLLTYKVMNPFLRIIVSWPRHKDYGKSNKQAQIHGDVKLFKYLDSTTKFLLGTIIKNPNPSTYVQGD